MFQPRKVQWLKLVKPVLAAFCFTLLALCAQRMAASFVEPVFDLLGRLLREGNLWSWLGRYMSTPVFWLRFLVVAMAFLVALTGFYSSLMAKCCVKQANDYLKQGFSNTDI